MSGENLLIATLYLRTINLRSLVPEPAVFLH